MDRTFHKVRANAPAGFFEAEAAGLRWLAEAKAVPVVDVIEVSDDGLTLERLQSTSPSVEAAFTFGANLARMHDAGAPAFGHTPYPKAWFGPLDQPFEVATFERETFSQFWADDRLRRLMRIARPIMREPQATCIDEAIKQIALGTFDGIAGGQPEPPSRVHGDLWSGNVMWTDDGAVLIDPAAHGGHRLEDLAMLALFGAPYLDEIYAGYESIHRMPHGWREDIPAHQLYGLLAHVVLFGRSYVNDTVRCANAILDVARARAPYLRS